MQKVLTVKNYYESISLKVLQEIIKSTQAALKLQQEIYTWRIKNIKEV
jgi:hypothetical protein